MTALAEATIGPPEEEVGLAPFANPQFNAIPRLRVSPWAK